MAEHMPGVAASNMARDVGGAIAPRGASLWDQSVVNDLTSFPYVRAVVFTDGRGSLLQRVGRLAFDNAQCDQLDLTLAALRRTGETLGFGALQVHIGTYANATIVTTAANELFAAVIADSGANLGQLLSLMRRVFPGHHE